MEQLNEQNGYIQEKDLKNRFPCLEKIPYQPFNEIQIQVGKADLIGKGTSGNVYSIKYEGESAAKQITINPGQNEQLFTAIEELQFMIKKADLENIIKIKAFSYQMNSQKQISQFYIIVEKFTSSLEIAIKNPKLFDLTQKLEIAIQITKGLKNLHTGDFRISHNDMQPENILIDYNQSKYGSATYKRLALTDFGISCVTQNELFKTKLGTHYIKGGSQLYMAPEQKQGKCYQYVTDIYGFGSTMADLFFGIKIEYGRKIQEFLDIQVETEIEIGIKNILERCLKEQHKERYPQIEEICNQLLQLKKYDLDLKEARKNCEIANIMLDSQQYSAALQMALKTVQILPNFQQGRDLIEQLQQIIRSNEEDAEHYCKIAVILHKEKMYKEAIQYANKAINLENKYKLGYQIIGNSLDDLNQFEEALENYRIAVGIDSNYKEVYNNMGANYLAQGQYDEAIQNFQTALNIDKKYKEAYHNMGFALQAQSQYDEALEKYQIILDIDSNYTDAYYNMGVVLEAQGKIQDALQNYQKAVKIDPTYKTAYYNMGGIYYAQKQYEKAIKNYQNAVAIDPQYQEAYINLGTVYLARRQYEEALKNYQMAVDIDQSYSLGYNGIGDIKRIQGQFDEAITNYGKTLSIDPSNTYASDGKILADQKKKCFNF